MILRRLRHRFATGNQATEYLSWSSTWAALGTVLLEKARSCFWRTSFAKAGDEMTTVVFRPSFKLMIGPWILASSARDLWGLSPSFRRFPMTGSGAGPGGSFGPALLLLSSERRVNKVVVNKRYRTKLKNSIFYNQKGIGEWEISYAVMSTTLRLDKAFYPDRQRKYVLIKEKCYWYSRNGTDSAYRVRLGSSRVQQK